MLRLTDEFRVDVGRVRRASCAPSSATTSSCRGGLSQPLLGVLFQTAPRRWQNVTVPVRTGAACRASPASPASEHLGGQSVPMAIQVETKDCTALTDADLDEMADMGGGAPGAIEIGLLSKAKEDWVLCSTRPHRRQAARVHVLHARAHRRHAVRAARPASASSGRRKRDAVLKGLMSEAFHRALMAFPDEDVLVGTRLRRPVGLRGLQGAGRHRPPSRPPGRRRGAGLGPAPGQAVRRRDRATTSRASWSRATASGPASTTSR